MRKGKEVAIFEVSRAPSVTASRDTAPALRVASRREAWAVSPQKCHLIREALELAREEVVADAMEDVLTDGEVIGDLVTHDESLWEKVKAWILQAIGKIRAAYKGLKPESNAGRAMAEFMHEEGAISELERIFSEGVKDAGARKRAAEIADGDSQTVGNVKYSLAEGVENRIDEILQNKFSSEEVLLTDNTPSIIVEQKGTKNYPMMMKPSHVRENILSEQEAKEQGLPLGERHHYHGLGKELFLDVIRDLDEVTEAYRGTKNAKDESRREKYFLLISEHKDKDGNVINVPVFINEKGQYNQVFVDVNKIATVFGKEELREYIRRQIASGNLVRIKKRSTQDSEPTRLFSARYDLNASDSSISQPPPVVNSQDKKSLKFSLGTNGERSEAGQKAKKDKPVDVVGQKAGAAYKEIDAWVNEVFSGDYSDGSSDDAGLSSTAKWTIRKGIAEAFSSVDRTATARKLAESILENVMITKYADPDAFDRYTRIYEVLGEYRKSLKLDGLREDLQHMEDDEWRTVYNRWNSDEVTARSPDAVKQEIEEAS